MASNPLTARESHNRCKTCAKEKECSPKAHDAQDPTNWGNKVPGWTANKRM